jgi:hypothetical protein
MPISDYFADTYAAAREKFLVAARTAGARLTAHTLPDHCGPQDEQLTLDVATLGPGDPDSVLLLISATHGVEGFCGSGCQVGYLADQLYGALPPRAGTILVHALNPYGFAWLRRVNEDNVDLNRNFQDFANPLPDSSAYEAIHDWLVPEDWDGPGRQAADVALKRFIEARGLPALQSAVSRGQYTRPTGLFYGGTRASWSNTTLRRILQDQLAPSVRKLAVLEFHTGLGPPGYGEPSYLVPPDAGFERAKKWYGPEVTSIVIGDAVSAYVTGVLPDAFRDLTPTIEVTHIAVEYGTRPIMEVLSALRADGWLHADPRRQTPLRGQIERQMRDAFYVDTPAWKAFVYGRAADLVCRASRGLASP